MSQESTDPPASSNEPTPESPQYLLIKLENEEHAAEIQNVLGGLKDTDASDAIKLHFTRGDASFPQGIEGNVMFASALRPGGGGRDIEAPDDDQSEEETPEEDSGSEKSRSDNEA